MEQLQHSDVVALIKLSFSFESLFEEKEISSLLASPHPPGDPKKVLLIEQAQNT